MIKEGLTGFEVHSRDRGKLNEVIVITLPDLTSFINMSGAAKKALVCISSTIVNAKITT